MYSALDCNGKLDLSIKNISNFDYNIVDKIQSRGLL